MPKTYQAIVAGHLCLDIIPDLSTLSPEEFTRHFLPGRLLTVGPVTYSTGGAVSNTGLAMNKLGLNTLLMGKVGADLLGEAVQQVVKSYGPHLAQAMIVDKTAQTSYTLVINPPGIDRTFLHYPGANDTFRAADVGYDWLAQARLFHFGYPPLMGQMFARKGAELAEMFRRARETGVSTSLDMAWPDPASASGQADWPAIIHATLPYVDICLPSAEEILYMLRRDTYHQLRQAAQEGDILPHVTPGLLSELGQELLELGVKIVGIKLGQRGVYLRTADRAALEAIGPARPADPALWANREMWMAPFRVEMVGATGAGDATIAGFLCALLRGRSPTETLTIAQAVGACNVEAADSLSGLRSWPETLDRIAAGWPRRPLTLNTPGWQFDQANQVWQKQK